ncbi:MAG: glycosyltransferase family 4 protein [Caldilineaceae bacterium]|nr:glycosyltransferase family 4 protein [Caldilineaceae bacterium]
MNAPLTIALIVNLYPPYIVGGNEILARDVAEGLRQRGHTVHILTGQGAQLPQDGFTHQALAIDLDRKADIFLGGLPLTMGRVWRWHLYNHQSYVGVQRTLAQLQPDLVIAWNLYMASAAPLMAARRFPFPLIAHPADKWLLYSLHDIGQLIPANNRKQRLALRMLKAVVQPFLRWRARPEYILAVSEFIRTLHRQAGYAAAQSRATYLGVHTHRFPYQAHAFPGPRRWRLIFAGQLWAGKGPQVAIEAIHRLRQQPDLPAVELNIYGGGAPNFIEYLARLIQEHGLEDQVFLRGFAAQSELAQAFHDHDLFLFCSIWDEPFSGGLLEAMGSGLPTIATTAGGTPEAIRQEENGLVVPPDDPQALAEAIARLMRDPELYQRVGRQAAAEVQARWSFAAYLDRLEEVYQAIVHGHRPDAPITLAQERE